MAETTDILVCGTGAFASRIVFDIAATADTPVRIGIAGRNEARLAWLKTAANARATIFGRPASFTTETVDFTNPETLAGMIARADPAVVVQAASVQTSSVISSRDNAWARLVAEGGLSATAVFQAILSLRVAQAMRDAGITAQFINCCFPDVVNGMLVAAGHPVTCGVGNIGILSNAFAASAGRREPGTVKVLAHYQTIGNFRLPSAARRGAAPRVWIDEDEIDDVFSRFQDVQLTAEPAIEISGACGIPLMLAMVAGFEWRGHVPGPNGLPGGYPVLWLDGTLKPDLAPGLTLADAVRWNQRFEEENGLTVGEDARIQYHGRLWDQLHQVSPTLADGFSVSDLDAAYAELAALRTRMQPGA